MTDALFAHGFLTDGDIACLIASKAGLARPMLQRSTRICDLRLPLEAYYAVLVAIEDHFDIAIDDLVGVDCATLGELMDRLKDRVARSRAPGRPLMGRLWSREPTSASDPNRPSSGLKRTACA
jgi:hypothetical protein